MGHFFCPLHLARLYRRTYCSYPLIQSFSFFAAYARWAYGAGYGYVLTSLRAYAYAAVLCARATPLRAYARLFLRTKPISAAPAHPFPRHYR